MTPALDGIDEAIRRLEGELEQLRTARATVARICGNGAPPHVPDPDPGRVRTKRVNGDDATTAGDLSSRILAYLAKQKAPVKFAVVRDALKAPNTSSTNVTMQKLVEAGKAVRRGHSVGLPSVMAEADPEGD